MKNSRNRFTSLLALTAALFITGCATNSRRSPEFFHSSNTPLTVEKEPGDLIKALDILSRPLVYHDYPR